MTRGVAAPHRCTNPIVLETSRRVTERVGAGNSVTPLTCEFEWCSRLTLGACVSRFALRELKCSCCSRGQCCHGRTEKSPDCWATRVSDERDPGIGRLRNQQVRTPNRVSRIHTLLLLARLNSLE